MWHSPVSMTENESLPSFHPPMTFMCTLTNMAATTRRTIKAVKDWKPKGKIHSGHYLHVYAVLITTKPLFAIYVAIPGEFSCLLWHFLTHGKEN